MTAHRIIFATPADLKSDPVPSFRKYLHLHFTGRPPIVMNEGDCISVAIQNADKPSSEPVVHLPLQTAEESDYKPAKWFEDHTTINGDSLRQAVASGKFLPSYGGKNKKRYSLSAAMRIWGSDIVKNNP